MCWLLWCQGCGEDRQYFASRHLQCGISRSVISGADAAKRTAATMQFATHISNWRGAGLKPEIAMITDVISSNPCSVRESSLRVLCLAKVPRSLSWGRDRVDCRATWEVSEVMRLFSFNHGDGYFSTYTYQKLTTYTFKRVNSAICKLNINERRKKENENERKDNERGPATSGSSRCEWGPVTSGSNRTYNPSYIKAPMRGHVAREIKWGDSETSAAVSDSNACLLWDPEQTHRHLCAILY